MARTFLGVAVAIALVACGDAERDQVARVASPDGRIEAMLYESSGGATTSYLYEIEVMPAGAPTDQAVLVAKLYGAIRNNSAYGANLRWANDSELSVEYFESKSATLVGPAHVAGRTVSIKLANGINDAKAPPGGMAYNLGKRPR